MFSINELPNDIGTRLVKIPDVLIVDKSELLFNHRATFEMLSASTSEGAVFVVTDAERLYGVAGVSEYNAYVLNRTEQNRTEQTFGDICNTNCEYFTMSQLCRHEYAVSQKRRMSVVVSDDNRPLYFLRMSNPAFMGKVIMDLNDACNLRCPGCPRGKRAMPNRQLRMNVDKFSELVGLLKERYNVQSFALYNWGEPFLTPNLDEYFDILSKNCCLGELSSNLSLPNISCLEKVVTHSALKYLHISVSGYTNEIHQIYHKGSDIDIVKKHLELISTLKTARPLNQIVSVKYLGFGYNNADAEPFQKYCDELGIGFRLMIGSREFEQPSEKQGWEEYDICSSSPHSFQLQSCCQNLNALMLDCSGDVYVCCYFPNIPEMKVGNVFSDSMDDIVMNRIFHPVCKTCKHLRLRTYHPYVKEVVKRKLINAGLVN